MAKSSKKTTKSASKKRRATTRSVRARSAARTSSRARPSAPAAERRANEVLVEQTIELLHAHERIVGQSFVRIGEHLLEEYFGGDVDLARSHDPTKPRSYARLVARAGAETDWDVADFRRAVVIALVARSLPSAMVEKIAPSRLVRLAAIDDPTERTALANRVANGELDDLTFRELVSRASGADRRGGGPKRMAGPMRIAAGVERILDLGDEVDAFDAKEIARVPETARNAIRHRLRAAIERLQVMVRALG